MLVAPLTPRSLRSPALVAALVALACGRADETDRAATPAVTPQVEAKAPAEHEAASSEGKGKGKRGALMSTGERAPALASKAPDFELSALDGATFELAKARAAGPVVLVFYRGHW